MAASFAQQRARDLTIRLIASTTNRQCNLKLKRTCRKGFMEGKRLSWRCFLKNPKNNYTVLAKCNRLIFKLPTHPIRNRNLHLVEDLGDGVAAAFAKDSEEIKQKMDCPGAKKNLILLDFKPGQIFKMSVQLDFFLERFHAGEDQQSLSQMPLQIFQPFDLGP